MRATRRGGRSPSRSRSCQSSVMTTLPSARPCSTYARRRRPSWPFSLSEELDGPLDEVLVELEAAAVPGVRVEDELAVRESSVEVDGVLAGHHPVALTVDDERRLVDGGKVGRLLLTPAVDGLELGAERAHGDGVVAV